MKKRFRRSSMAQYLFHLALVFSFLVLGAASSWAIVVTSTNNSGAGSLRQAIIDANADGVATLITFNLAVFPPPPGAPGTIFLTSQLPALTGAGDTIDATGAGVVIDGSALVAPDRGITVRRSNITVRGLTVQNFPGDGIRVDT
jgi:hypothetical protein